MANFDDFNSGSLASFWTSAGNYSVEVVAGQGILSFDGNPSQNLNSVTVGSGESRQITTTALDLTGNGTIEFDLLIGDGGTTAWGEFENADGGEDVVLAYSIDGGTSFVTIQIFDTEASATLGQFGSFNIIPPAAAQTAATILRWSQLSNSGSGFDHWALDNVKINGIAHNDAFTTDDITTITGNVFADNGGGPDDATNAPLTVTAVDGQLADVGQQISLPSGALVTIEANGDFTYIPSQTIPDGEVITDQFSYGIQDGSGVTDTGLVFVNVSGLDNDDVIIGTPGDDILSGGLGNDIITGAGGDDVIDGGAGDDDLNGNAGYDTVSYASAAAGVTVDLTLQAAAQDTIGAGLDTLNGFINLQGSGFSDTLFGANNDNILDGGAGADTMSGRAGDDLYLVDDPGDVVIELFAEGLDSIESSVSYTLSENVEILTLIGTADISGTGNGGDNLLIGNAGNNVLIGGDGTDVLIGGEGADDIDGGNGIDRLEFAAANQGIAINLQLGTGSAGEAMGDTYANIEEVFSTSFADIISGSAADENVRGRAGNDTISGNGGSDILLGGSGADIIQGGDGDDFLYGQSGDDRLTGGDMNDRLRGHAGNDVLFGGDGRDDLRGGVGDDSLFGGSGNDFLMGEFGADLIEGGDGNDQVRAGGGNDVVDGGAGDDRLYGQAGDDHLNGGSGNDRIRGNGGIDELSGGDDTDDVRGGNGDDTLFGNDGTDYLFGGAGEDILIGGAGNDSLTGGDGGGVPDNAKDTFVYSDTAVGGGGFDRIKDWEDGTDVIDLTSFSFANFAMVGALATNAGAGDMRITFGGGDVLYIEDFTTVDFDASDVLI